MIPMVQKKPRSLSHEPKQHKRKQVRYRPFALRGHVTSFLWKWKLYDFAFEKLLVGHILNKVIVIWFFNPAPFS